MPLRITLAFGTHTCKQAGIDARSAHTARTQPHTHAHAHTHTHTHTHIHTHAHGVCHTHTRKHSSMHSSANVLTLAHLLGCASFNPPSASSTVLSRCCQPLRGHLPCPPLRSSVRLITPALPCLVPVSHCEGTSSALHYAALCAADIHTMEADHAASHAGGAQCGGREAVGWDFGRGEVRGMEGR